MGKKELGHSDALRLLEDVELQATLARESLAKGDEPKALRLVRMIRDRVGVLYDSRWLKD